MTRRPFEFRPRSVGIRISNFDWIPETSKVRYMTRQPFEFRPEASGFGFRIYLIQVPLGAHFDLKSEAEVCIKLPRLIV